MVAGLRAGGSSGGGGVVPVVLPQRPARHAGRVSKPSAPSHVRSTCGENAEILTMSCSDKMAFRSLRTHELIAWGGSILTVTSMYYLFIAMPRLAADGAQCRREHSLARASPDRSSPSTRPRSPAPRHRDGDADVHFDDAPARGPGRRSRAPAIGIAIMFTHSQPLEGSDTTPRVAGVSTMS